MPGFKSSINTGLPNLPEPPDPAFTGEFIRLYNAIKILQLALDSYTGALSADSDVMSEVGSDGVLLQNLTRLYVPASVAIAEGQTVHLYDNAGVLTAELADASTTAQPCHGWCSIGGAPGEYIEVQLQGKCTQITGLTLGVTYYQSDTPGVVSNLPGTTTQRVGFAIGTSELYFSPTLV